MEPDPRFAHRLQQSEGARHVCPHELVRGGNGKIVVRLRCEVNAGIGRGQQFANEVPVADVAVHETQALPV